MEAAAPQPQLTPGRQLIQGYREGGFTVAGVRHEGSVLVFPERTLAWPVGSFAELSLEALGPVQAVAAELEILVVGMGTRFELFPPALRQAIRAWGPVVEAMATPAACRTYNVLLTEERRVAAALIAMPPVGA